MSVFTYEHMALFFIFLVFFRPLCSPCWHIYVCVCVFEEKEDGGSEWGVHACTHMCVCACACVWTQPSPYNLITKIRRLKKYKADFNLEQI